MDLVSCVIRDYAQRYCDARPEDIATVWVWLGGEGLGGKWCSCSWSIGSGSRRSIIISPICPSSCQASYRPSFPLACFPPNSNFASHAHLSILQQSIVFSLLPLLTHWLLQRANHLALQKATANHYAILSRCPRDSLRRWNWSLVSPWDYHVLTGRRIRSRKMIPSWLTHSVLFSSSIVAHDMQDTTHNVRHNAPSHGFADSNWRDDDDGNTLFADAGSIGVWHS